MACNQYEIDCHALPTLFFNCLQIDHVKSLYGLSEGLAGSSDGTSPKLAALVAVSLNLRMETTVEKSGLRLVCEK